MFKEKVECLYFYPAKAKDGEKVSEWIIGHAAFKIFTGSYDFAFYDCAVIRNKDNSGCFISPPNKNYTNKENKKVFVKYWALGSEEQWNDFQEKAKQAILVLCELKTMSVPKELQVSSS